MKTTSKSDYDSVFAKKLRDMLENNSISMTKLAKELGVKQQTVSQWADGSTTPNLIHLKPLASYFKISIDELVTGVAPENEEIHLNTGLSNLAIKKLNQLKTDGIDDAGNYNKFKNEIIVEFLNIIIESIDSKVYSLSRLAQLCMDYIIGAHEHILWQEDAIKKQAEGWEIFCHIDRPNLKNDELDFKTYRLTKDFEYFIEHLTKNHKTAERVKMIYKKGNRSLPDYSDRRFK